MQKISKEICDINANPKSKLHKKRVSFKEDLEIVHVQHTWLFAMNQSRKGNWEEIARDSERFLLTRIIPSEFIIGPVLVKKYFQYIHNLQIRKIDDMILSISK